MKNACGNDSSQLGGILPKKASDTGASSFLANLRSQIELEAKEGMEKEKPDDNETRERGIQKEKEVMGPTFVTTCESFTPEINRKFLDIDGGNSEQAPSIPRFKQKPIPPPRKKNNAPLSLKSMGAPLSLDESLTLAPNLSRG